jgi:DMSO/TMAO reductase YedYZ molybdopterin-dependent catalytic subunit
LKSANVLPEFVLYSGGAALFKSCHWPKTVLVFMAMGASILLFVVLQAVGPAAQLSTAVVVRVSGAVSQPLALSLQDLAAMPRTKITVKEHDTMATYEGVALTEILQKAGAPLGKQMHGKALASYVLVTARDGYRVVFALPELDPDFTDASQHIILADTADGKPLPEKQGPVRIVVPNEKKGARWIRMVESIEVVKLP